MEVLHRKCWSLGHICTGAGNGGHGCGSLLRMVQTDLRYYPGSGYPTYRDEAVVFRCPVCTEVTDIDRELWPPNKRALIRFTQYWSNTGSDPEEGNLD